MENNLKDQDVLLVREKGGSELNVADMDKDGKVKQAKPDSENPDLLKIDRHGNILENFFENFMRQVKDPTRFEFFRVPAEKLKEVAGKLQEALKSPDKPENRDFIDMHRVEPGEFLKKQEQAEEQTRSSSANNAIDENRVNWSQFERLGISRNYLEKTGNLDRLLNWQKTDLLPVSLKFDDVSLRTDARLALRENPEGVLSVSIHALRKEPELDRYYFGMKFSEEDKQNLRQTGNLGRVAEVQYRQGETTPVFLSIDKLTNELVAVRADRIRIPDTIKGVQLNDGQKKDLSEGKAVWIEGMTSKNGKTFSAYLQFNAEKRGFEFRFDNEKQEQAQKQGNGQENVPKTFRGRELTGEQRDSLREGKTVHVDGLVDKKGIKYSGYITLNKETGKTDFMFPKQDKEALAAGKVIPDDRHKTQVAVNSEGKTNEATKNEKEPVKKGQTQPSEKQAEKQEKQEKKTEKKANRLKM
jgi:hypothetical protein